MTSIREKFTAEVSSTEDPERRGRIKVICGALLGNEDEALPNWIEPIADWGWFYVPNVGELVELEMVVADSDDRSPGAISIGQGDLRWRGRYWGNSEGAAPTAIPGDFTDTNYGKRRGFATPAGHVFMFDDTDGARKISITMKVQDASQEAGTSAEYSYFALDKGNVVLANKKGTLLSLDAANGSMMLIDEHGNNVSSSSSGIQMVDKAGNFVSCNGTDTINIVSAGTVNLRCKNAVIDGGKIELTAGATDAMLKSSVFEAIFASHTHAVTSAPGTTGPPNPPNNSLATALSAKCFNG
jgi:hypothetical protein